LYNLENDVEEKNDLANQFPKKVKELASLLEKSRSESKHFNFN
jgi:hypothetical protein